MKSITIRQLQSATRKWVRQVALQGGLEITDRGTVLARLLPLPPAPAASPYFSRRTLLPQFKATMCEGCVDSTVGISADRDAR